MGKVTDKVDEAKAWWKSKTIIGTILMFLPALIKMIWPNSEIDVQGTVDEVWLGSNELAGYADSIWASVTSLIGAALAIYGRLKAKVGIK